MSASSRVEIAPGLVLDVIEERDVEGALARAIENDTPAPYGAVLWPSGVGLARRLADGVPLEGARVLDVGTGTGITALVAARLGASVLAVDIDLEALERVRTAAAAQGLRIETEAFDITSPEPLPRADVVIIADLLYEAPLADSVGRRAIEAWRAGAEVWVADPGRVHRDRFLAALAEAGEPTEPAHVEKVDDGTIAIWHLIGAGR